MYSVNVTCALCGVVLVRLGLVCGACVFRCVALGSEPGTGESEHPFRTVRFFWGVFGDTKTFRDAKVLHYSILLKGEEVRLLAITLEYQK